MWMPVMEASRPDTNGMMVARRSHRDHMEYIRNGTWDRHEGSTSGHLEFMRFWRHLGETSETLAPTLNLGDVLVFSKVNSFTGKSKFFTSIFSAQFTRPAETTVGGDPGRPGRSGS